MSSTAAPEPGDAADQAYFRELEAAFLALRGTATLLSPEDWHVARDWRRLGIPIDLVVSVMESLFERQRERKSRRGISSLRYFRAAVDAAWDERSALSAGAGGPHADPGPPARQRLEALARALPLGLPGRAELHAAILELDGPLDVVERALAELELGALARLDAGLATAERGELEARVERALAQVPGELAAVELEALRGRLRRQALRSRLGLPVLSLFAPEALGVDSSAS